MVYQKQFAHLNLKTSSEPLREWVEEWERETRRWLTPIRHEQSHKKTWHMESSPQFDF